MGSAGMRSAKSGVRASLKSRAFYILPHDFRRRVYARVRPGEFKSLQESRTSRSESGFSLRPLDEYRCIFVHIPKTAGISVSRSLFGNNGPGHETLRRFQIVFSEREYDTYFKFAFVRNPWDRVYSAYNFLRKGGWHEADRDWAQAHLSRYSDFNEFVSSGLGRTEVYNWLHFKPQLSFLWTPGKRQFELDFLGYFENLEEDYGRIAARLGARAETGLRKDNIGKRDGKVGYREAYTEKSRRLVADLFACDINAFGYDFESSTLERQLERRRAAEAG